MEMTKEEAILGSPAAKAEYMKNLCFSHRNLEDKLAEVQRRMTPGAGFSVTMLVGPTGVGKTTFGKLMVKRFLKQYEVQIQENPGCIPAVLSEVAAPGAKEINWPLFYQHCLRDMLVPNWTNSAPEVELNVHGVERPADRVRSFRLLFENAIEFRSVRHFVLDEVVHFTDSETDPLQYGNLLKSLANRSGMNLLLIGAYGSEQLSLASGQLARRIGVVDYKRYFDTDADRAAYGDFVYSLQESIPLKEAVNLGPHVGLLFEGSFGLVGLTAEIVRRAVVAAAEAGGKWKDDYLFQSMLSPAAFQRVVAETVQGEERVVSFLSSTKRPAYPSLDEVRKTLLRDGMGA
ncbi:AAA family ATPase [Ralstonia pseudosolanacearum]|uniref:AAA family ATPase n=2 Tax=Ralstonia pseudosolanacearum TaxID=1310165 RepID=UPI0026766866|nr:AAA family ATPase [Ralstonia pseudosolanacearum]MDO3529441.1 AAA family ATPase [Ralstonia pseudosolanacearum]